MGNIPISEIPNMPQMPEPVVGQPGGAGGGQGGMINLMDAAAKMQRPTLDLNAFNGPAQGLANLGKGISDIAGKVGAVAQDFAQRVVSLEIDLGRGGGVTGDRYFEFRADPFDGLLCVVARDVARLG